MWCSLEKSSCTHGTLDVVLLMCWIWGVSLGEYIRMCRWWHTAPTYLLQHLVDQALKYCWWWRSCSTLEVLKLPRGTGQRCSEHQVLWKFWPHGIVLGLSKPVPSSIVRKATGLGLTAYLTVLWWDDGFRAFCDGEGHLDWDNAYENVQTSIWVHVFH